MLSTFRDVRGPDVDDGTSDTLGRGDDDVVVFGDLESIERFHLTSRLVDGWLVQDSLVDGVWYRIVDKFAEDETVYGIPVSADLRYGASRGFLPLHSSNNCMVSVCIGRMWSISLSPAKTWSIGCASCQSSLTDPTIDYTHSIDMFREGPSFILVDGMLGICSRRALYRDLSLLCLQAIGDALLQQAMQLHPILDFYFSTGIDRCGFKSFSSLVVARLA
jgi:hypothetical protein